MGGIVAGIAVGDAGTCVGATVTGITVFVGRGDGLVEGDTATDRSHAVAVTMTIERNKRAFLTFVLYMAKSPFMLKHTPQTRKTPPSPGEFSLSDWTVQSSGQIVTGAADPA